MTSNYVFWEMKWLYHTIMSIYCKNSKTQHFKFVAIKWNVYTLYIYDISQSLSAKKKKKKKNLLNPVCKEVTLV